MSAPLPGAGAAETGFAAEIIRDLAHAHELATGFELCFVLGDRPRALAHVREQLRQRRAAPFHVLEPGDDIVPALRALGEQMRAGTPRPIVWIQQATFDATTCRHVLSQLNQQRSWLRAHVPAMLVLAGPRALGEIASANAADLWSVRGPVRTVEGEPAIVPSRTSVRWLHLSDFHFRERMAWDQRPPLEALERWLRERATRGERPDLVFVTGDIAWSGRDGEYELAEDYFRRLADVLELDPRRRWFVVPGNHDVDQNRIRLVDGRILDGIDDPDSLAEIQEDAESMRLLGRRLERFYAFTERFLGPVRAWRIEAPWRADVVDLDGLQVGVLQLNSTWAGGLRGDQGRLVLGDVQVRACLEMTRDAHLRVALMHHPLADLAAFDRDRAGERLAAADGADLVLRGHLHESRAVRHEPAHAREPGGYCEIAAGAAYVRDRLYTGFHLGEIDMAAGRATVQQLTYSDRGRGFWAPDTRAYEHAPDGRLIIELPRLRDRVATIEDHAPVAPVVASAALDRDYRDHRDHLVARYRQAAAAYHGAVRFLGMPRGAHGPHVHVEKLFVPLGFVPPSGDPAAQERMSTAELAARLVPQPGRAPGRFVILGGPGSGKSTLCQYLAVLLAGEERLDDVAVPDDVLPLLIRLRDYAPEIGRANDLGLVAFLELQARRDLAVPVPDGFLDERLAAGRAVLLLDGLDEVGSPEHRATLRDRVQAFCRAYPRVPALVTSRIAGYDDAPLAPKHEEARPEAEGFVHLRVAPFSDDDLGLFIDRWYEAQDYDDPRERRRRATVLQERLLAEPRARDLARTPLLATLLALVHDDHGELPGKRARLYQLCIETLLARWPAHRDRRFDELDTALQQHYLEDLALAMQCARARTNPDTLEKETGLSIAPLSLTERDEGAKTSVTATHTAVLDTLVAILNERGPGGELLRDRAARWLDFLVEASGILQEQRHGRLGFVHLAFMESLAARALHRAPQERLVLFIARFCTSSAWTEVFLLVVGLRANDRSFLDALAEAFQAPSYAEATFLLAALKEEADFRPRQRERILRDVADAVMETDPREGAPEQGDVWERITNWRGGAGLPADWDVLYLVQAIVHTSRRHGSGVAQWLRRSLMQEQGEDLLRALVLDPGEASVAIIKERTDVESIAPRLLELWPGVALGHWALQRCRMADVLPWVLGIGGEDLAVLRALVTFDQPEAGKLAPALSVLLARVAHDWARRARDSLARADFPAHLQESKRAVLGLGTARSPVVSIMPLLPLPDGGPSSVAAPRRSRWFLRHPSAAYAKSLGDQIERHLVAPEHWFRWTFSDVFGVLDFDLFETAYNWAFALWGSKYKNPLMSYFQDYLAETFPSHEVAAANHLADMAGRFSDLFAPRLDDERPVSRPDHCHGCHPWLMPDIDQTTSLVPLAVESCAALALPGDYDTWDYLRHRIQHRFLLEMWPAWEATLPAELDAHRLALYLALGWAQCTVTAMWPGTPRWTALLGGPPPAHWLARAHWHLCWLVYEPEDAAHLQGYRDALAEGRLDDELPGHADEMPGMGM